VEQELFLNAERVLHSFQVGLCAPILAREVNLKTVHGHAAIDPGTAFK